MASYVRSVAPDDLSLFLVVPAPFPLLDAVPAKVWDQCPIAIPAVVVKMTPVTLFLVPLLAQLA